MVLVYVVFTRKYTLAFFMFIICFSLLTLHFISIIPIYSTVVESYDCSQNFMTAVIVIIMTMTAVMPFLGPNHDYDCSHSHNDYDCSHSHDYRCSSCSHNFDYDCSHDYSHDCRTRSTVCNL